MTATTWGLTVKYGPSGNIWGVQQYRDADGTIVSIHPDTFDTMQGAQALALRLNRQAEHYETLDAVVAEISKRLNLEVDGKNYEAGGHTAYAVWLLPEDAAYAHGALLSVILAETVEGCEFIVQGLSGPSTTDTEHYPFTKGA